MKVVVDTIERDRGFKKLVVGLEDAKGSYVDVGIFGGRGVSSETGTPILTYAIANEFGATIVQERATIKIPERSFLRSTADEIREDIRRDLETGLAKIGLGQETTKSVLTKVGVKVRSATSKKIRNGPFVANAPSTIERKKSSRPLIDTGTMRKALEYKLGKVFDKKTGKIT